MSNSPNSTPQSPSAAYSGHTSSLGQSTKRRDDAETKKRKKSLPEGMKSLYQIKRNKEFSTIIAKKDNSYVTTRCYHVKQCFHKQIMTNFSNITKRLNYAQNVVLPSSITQHKGGIFEIRQYISYNLSQFLESNLCVGEGIKFWITYGIINSLIQIYGGGLKHSSISVGNVLVTGQGWTLLSDISVNRPSIFPIEQPNIFYKYYPRSQETSCTLNPMRFQTFLGQFQGGVNGFYNFTSGSGGSVSGGGGSGGVGGGGGGNDSGYSYDHLAISQGTGSHGRGSFILSNSDGRSGSVSSSKAPVIIVSRIEEGDGTTSDDQVFKRASGKLENFNLNKINNGDSERSKEWGGSVPETSTTLDTERQQRCLSIQSEQPSGQDRGSLTNSQETIRPLTPAITGENNQDAIDDNYSLGCVLYELFEDKPLISYGELMNNISLTSFGRTSNRAADYNNFITEKLIAIKNPIVSRLIQLLLGFDCVSTDSPVDSQTPNTTDKLLDSLASTLSQVQGVMFTNCFQRMYIFINNIIRASPLIQAQMFKRALPTILQEIRTDMPLTNKGGSNEDNDTADGEGPEESSCDLRNKQYGPLPFGYYYLYTNGSLRDGKVIPNQNELIIRIRGICVKTIGHEQTLTTRCLNALGAERIISESFDEPNISLVADNAVLYYKISPFNLPNQIILESLLVFAIGLLRVYNIENVMEPSKSTLETLEGDPKKDETGKTKLPSFLDKHNGHALSSFRNSVTHGGGAGNPKLSQGEGNVGDPNENNAPHQGTGAGQKQRTTFKSSVNQYSKGYIIDVLEIIKILTYFVDPHVTLNLVIPALLNLLSKLKYSKVFNEIKSKENSKGGDREKTGERDQKVTKEYGYAQDILARLSVDPDPTSQVGPSHNPVTPRQNQYVFGSKGFGDSSAAGANPTNTDMKGGTSSGNNDGGNAGGGAGTSGDNGNGFAFFGSSDSIITYFINDAIFNSLFSVKNFVHFGFHNFNMHECSSTRPNKQDDNVSYSSISPTISNRFVMDVLKYLDGENSYYIVPILREFRRLCYNVYEVSNVFQQRSNMLNNSNTRSGGGSFISLSPGYLRSRTYIHTPLDNFIMEFGTTDNDIIKSCSLYRMSNVLDTESILEYISRADNEKVLTKMILAIVPEINSVMNNNIAIRRADAKLIQMLTGITRESSTSGYFSGYANLGNGVGNNGASNGIGGNIGNNFCGMGDNTSPSINVGSASSYNSGIALSPSASQMNIVKKSQCSIDGIRILHDINAEMMLTQYINMLVKIIVMTHKSHQCDRYFVLSARRMLLDVLERMLVYNEFLSSVNATISAINKERRPYIYEEEIFTGANNISSFLIYRYFKGVHTLYRIGILKDDDMDAIRSKFIAAMDPNHWSSVQETILGQLQTTESITKRGKGKKRADGGELTQYDNDIPKAYPGQPSASSLSVFQRCCFTKRILNNLGIFIPETPKPPASDVSSSASTPPANESFKGAGNKMQSSPSSVEQMSYVPRSPKKDQGGSMSTSNLLSPSIGSSITNSGNTTGTKDTSSDQYKNTGFSGFCSAAFYTVPISTVQKNRRELDHILATSNKLKLQRTSQNKFFLYTTNTSKMAWKLLSFAGGKTQQKGKKSTRNTQCDGRPRLLASDITFLPREMEINNTIKLMEVDPYCRFLVAVLSCGDLVFYDTFQSLVTTISGELEGSGVNLVDTGASDTPLSSSKTLQNIPQFKPVLRLQRSKNSWKKLQNISEACHGYEDMTTSITLLSTNNRTLIVGTLSGLFVMEVVLTSNIKIESVKVLDFSILKGKGVITCVEYGEPNEMASSKAITIFGNPGTVVGGGGTNNELNPGSGNQSIGPGLFTQQELEQRPFFEYYNNKRTTTPFVGTNTILALMSDNKLVSYNVSLKKTIFKYKLPYTLGTPTCLCIPPITNTYFCLIGTNLGFLMLFDTRFRMVSCVWNISCGFISCLSIIKCEGESTLVAIGGDSGVLVVDLRNREVSQVLLRVVESELDVVKDIDMSIHNPKCVTINNYHMVKPTLGIGMSNLHIKQHATDIKFTSTTKDSRKCLLIGYEDGSVIHWDIDNGGFVLNGSRSHRAVGEFTKSRSKDGVDLLLHVESECNLSVVSPPVERIFFSGPASSPSAPPSLLFVSDKSGRLNTWAVL